MNRLFRHRFDRGELAGHAFGNLFLAALTEVVGSFDAAVARSGACSRSRAASCPRRRHPGRARWPRWTTAATSRARRPWRAIATACGGSSSSPRRRRRQPAGARGGRARRPDRARARARSSPRRCRRCSCPACGRAVLNARGLRVYVCNLLQQPGETIGYRASHHVERLHQHVGARVVDSVHGARGARSSTEQRSRSSSTARGCAELGVRVVAAQIVADGRLPPRPRGARTRARARRPAPRAQRPCRSLRTSAPSSPRSLPAQQHCRLAQLAGVVRHAGTFHLLAGGAVEVHVDLASSLGRAPHGRAPARRAAPPARSAPTASTASSARRAS